MIISKSKKVVDSGLVIVDLERRLEVAIDKLNRIGVVLSDDHKQFMFKAAKLFREALKKIGYKDEPGHGLEHIFRVLELSLFLWSKEGGDLKKIILSVLFHDIDINPKKGHAERSARFAREFLRANGYEDIADEVARIIEEHSYSAGKTPSSLESAILQDADRLDALGAIGVARVFVYSGSTNRSLYDPLSPRMGGALRHFYEKIVKLADIMNTQTARNIALRRLNLVWEFLRRFEDEISLKDLVS